MTLTLNCPQCQQEITVDAAFAGGVCRCPSCKAQVVVPGQIGECNAADNSGRPDAPIGTSQPQTKPAEPVPLTSSRPGMLQRVLLLLLLIGLGIMTVAVIVMLAM